MVSSMQEDLIDPWSMYANDVKAYNVNHQMMGMKATSILLLSMVLLEAQHQQQIHKVHAWSWTQLSNAGAAPRVSGHTTVTDDDGRILLFGGLTGNAGSPCTDDLWTHTNDDGWKHVSKQNGPGKRMYSAAAMLNNDMYLLGGWDPGEPKSGGVFLDDVWKLDGQTLEWTLMEDKLPCGPVSRHTACSVGNQIIVHTFRGVCVMDSTGKWTEKETTGEAPDGLSMCAMVPLSDSSVLVFGGSTKTQQLSADAFVLDTNSWTWTKLDANDNNSDGPSPRASPCAAKWKENQAVIFGGASLGDGGYQGGAGLQAQRDTWLLSVKDNCKANWSCLDVDNECPNARLAATLSPASDGGLMLQGGWDPKGKTFEDTWVLNEK